MDLSSGVSRRGVVKAGVAAAWTVPLVQVATAAPALAVSGYAQLSFGYTEGIRVPQGKKLIKFWVEEIRNDGQGSLGQVTVVFRIPKEKTGSFANKPNFDGGLTPGWTFVGVSGQGPWDFTFISNEGVGVSDVTPELRWNLAIFPNGGSNKEVVVATAHASGASTSTSITLKTGKGNS